MSHSSQHSLLLQNRIDSARRASAAVKTALGELSPSSRLRLRQRGLTSTRPLTTTEAQFGGVRGLAFATKPSITFSVNKQGKLETPDILGTARHEVAHFSLPGERGGGREHLALKAAGAKGFNATVTSGAQLRTAESTIRLPAIRQVQLSLSFLNSRTRRKRISQVK